MVASQGLDGSALLKSVVKFKGPIETRNSNKFRNLSEPFSFFLIISHLFLIAPSLCVRWVFIGKIVVSILNFGNITILD